MLKRRFTVLGSAGDTIVEVMVALAILGLALSICYATASRSLLNTRQAQENSTATTIAQSQIESLISMAGNNSSDPNYIFRSSPFCIINETVTSYTSDSDSDSDCQNQSSGGMNPIEIEITPPSNTDPNSLGGIFEVYVTWPDVDGQGQDSVTMFYKLYPPAS